MKNKLFLKIILCWGIVFLTGCNQGITSSDTSISDMPEENSISSEVQADDQTASEPSDSIVDASVEESLPEEENSILFSCEEKVLENPLFEQFLSNEITACDNIKDSQDTLWGDGLFDFYGQEFYLRELYQAYYQEYAEELLAVKIRARDLNQDGKEELLILMEYGEHECNLHVFSENDEKLYAWECWHEIITIERYINLYENGTIRSWERNGDQTVARYNAKGSIEVVLLYRFQKEYIKPNDTQKYIIYHEITLYEDGKVQKEFSFKVYHGFSDKAEMTLEDQEVSEQYQEVLAQLHEEWGETGYISCIKSEEGAEQITPEQFLNGYFK